MARPRRPLSLRRRPTPSSSCESAGGLAVPEHIDSAADPTATLAADVTPVPGMTGLRLDGYVIDEEIGRGGYGRILAAQQKRFDRPVAIKTLLSDHRCGPQHANFIAEALVTAQLQHPGVVPIYDLDEVEGEIRLVMKRVEGVSWHDLLHATTGSQRQRAARFALDDHLEVLHKIAETLAYAHDRGVLHRDVKPQNVMIGDYGEVYLMDWGCAVTHGGHAISGVRHVSQVERVTGTPAYLAPEMARCEATALGPHSDVYLLGACLYEVLTGHRPHAAGNAREAVRLAARGKVVPVQQRAPQRRIPDELAGLCRYAMRSDRAKRLGSAKEFAARLKRYFKHRDAEALVDRAHAYAARAEAGETPLEHYGRAVTCLEQALELWPRCRMASEGLTTVGLAYARRAYASEAFTLAASQATQVVAQATALELEQEADEAAALAAQAAQAQADRAQRQMQMRRLRRISRLLAAILGLGLGGAAAFSTIMLWRLDDESEARERTQRLAAPAWVTRARETLDEGRVAEAREFVDLALAFDPDSAEARLLQAQVLICEGDLASAAELLAEHGSPALVDLAERLDGFSGDPADDELAAALQAAGLQAAAQMFHASGQGRGAGLQAQLEAAYPGQRFRLEPSGDGWSLALDRVTSLAGLRGLPLTGLELTLDEQVTSLRDLEGLPVTRLVLRSQGVVDISALARLPPLTDLDLQGLPITSIAPLRGCPLRRLALSGLDELVDLSPVAGLAALEEFEHHHRGGRIVFDAAWLRDKPIARLTLGGLAELLHPETLGELPLQALCASDWRCPLEALRFHRAPRLILDHCTEPPLELLVHAGLRDLTLSSVSCAGLAALHEAPLQRLALHGVRGFAGSDLSAPGLQELVLGDGCVFTGLAVLLDREPPVVRHPSASRPLPGFPALWRWLLAQGAGDDQQTWSRFAWDEGRLQGLDLSGLGIAELGPVLEQAPRALDLSFTALGSLAGLERLPLDSLHLLGAPLDGPDTLAGLAALDARNPWLARLAGRIDSAGYRRALRIRDSRALPWEWCYEAMALRLHGDEAGARAVLDALDAEGERAAQARVARLRAAWQGE